MEVLLQRAALRPRVHQLDETGGLQRVDVVVEPRRLLFEMVSHLHVAIDLSSGWMTWRVSAAEPAPAAAPA